MASPSNPGFVTGQVPTAAQWNSYFTAKADYNGDGSFATLEVSGASVLTGSLTANGAVSGSGITALFASPPAIGGTTPAAAVFTDLTVGANTATQAQIYIDAAATDTRALYWLTAGNGRWALNLDNVAESGSNAGADFQIQRYNDAGTVIDTPFTITRSTGVSTASSIVVTGATTLGNGSANYLVITGNTSGNSPYITATGSDAAIDVVILPKTGGALITNNFTAHDISTLGFASTNYLVINGAATGNGPTISAAGGDTNIALVLTPKGTGAVTIGGGGAFSAGGIVSQNINNQVTSYALSGSENPQIFQSIVNALSGSTTNTDVYLNSIVVTSDSLAAAGGVSAMQVFEIFGGATATGGRTSLNIGLLQTATTGNTSGTPYYTALDVSSTAEANDNGTSSTYQGNVFAAAFTASLKTGATYFQELVGLEIDIDAESGSSAGSKIGIQVVQLPTDVVSASLANTAIQIVGKSSGTASGWAYAYSVGGANGIWPMASSGTTVLFGAVPTSLGGNAYAATYGVKIDNVAIANGAFVSSGFVVTGTGAAYSNLPTATITTTTGTTLTAAQVVGAAIFRSGPTAVFTDTTDTATNIVAAIPGATVNASWKLRYVNRDASTCTIAGGTGVTISGTATVAASTWRDFICTITNTATPAVTMTSAGSGTAT